MEEDRIALLMSTLIQSLYGAAMVAMGKVPDPATGETAVDLARAQFNIDLLEALEVRTRGQLSAPERSLLQALLTNLRLTFVAEVRRSKEKEAGSTAGPESDARTERPATNEAEPADNGPKKQPGQ